MSKSTYFTGQPIFSQLLNLIPRKLVSRLSRQYGSNHYCKRFMAYDHLVTMLYAGFYQCTSLRELVTGLCANANRLNHLGLTGSPKRSTLSDANSRRSSDFFGALYHELYKFHFGLPDSRKKKDGLFIIDSTTISLFSMVMHGAGGYGADGKKKGGAKAHMMVDAKHDLPVFVNLTEAKQHDLTFLKTIRVPDHSTVVLDKAYINHHQFLEWDKRKVKWVTRIKKDAYIELLHQNPVKEEAKAAGVLQDHIIMLGRPSNRNKTPLIKARWVEYYDPVKNRLFQFISNDLKCEPQTITDIYKRRWQIELLFKRLKRTYPLKYFLGDNPNAIKIQIWSALICDLLIKIVQKQVEKARKKACAYANIAGLIRHHLMSYLKLVPFLVDPEKIINQFKPPEFQTLLF